MARLASMFDGDTKKLGFAKIPLYIDEKITMIMELDSEFVAENVCPSKGELEKFVKRYRLLSKDELKAALLIEEHDFFTLNSQMVQCVGCRRSVEALYYHVMNSDIPAFHPMVIEPEGSLKLAEGKDSIVYLWNLFNNHSQHRQTMLESLAKSKPGRRCDVHSLEAQRFRAVTSWLDVWEYMDETCQESATIIDSDVMTVTVSQYLMKHRFCMECKQQVLKAFQILLGEEDPSCDAGFVPDLYTGIQACKKNRHIHVACTTSYITSLITRCVPELAGSSRRERHAKTMEIAQEEVLICLGLCIFERLHRIQQRFCTEERAWEIIMCVGAQAIKNSFDLAVEKKLGDSQLELLCQEFEKEDKAKGKRKKPKKPKKKNSDKVQPVPVVETKVNEETKPHSPNIAPSSSESNSKKKKNRNKSGKKPDVVQSPKADKIEIASHDDTSISEPSRSSPLMPGYDCGYSSGNNVDNLSCSSPEGSETLGSEGCCGSTQGTHPKGTPSLLKCVVLKPQASQPYRSLEEQLDDAGSDLDDFEVIPEEEISVIYDPKWQEHRQAQRLKIRLNFDNLISSLRERRDAEISILQNTSAKSNAQWTQEALVTPENDKAKIPQERIEKKVEEIVGGKENQKSVQQTGAGKKSRQGHGGQVSRRYKGKNRR